MSKFYDATYTKVLDIKLNLGFNIQYIEMYALNIFLVSKFESKIKI